VLLDDWPEEVGRVPPEVAAAAEVVEVAPPPDVELPIIIPLDGVVALGNHCPGAVGVTGGGTPEGINRLPFPVGPSKHMKVASGGIGHRAAHSGPT